jgi:dethiobiotin synthetase
VTPVLVTGTDTAVGKTIVSRAILRALADAGHEPVPIKPVETGLEPGHDGTLRSQDGALLHRASRTRLPEALVAPIRLRLPAAPATAARAEGTVISIADVLAAIDRVRDDHPLLVEGAGGLLVPIGPDGSFADLARGLGARLVIVARNALGTINHTLLTIEAAHARGLEVAAVVLNETPGRHDALPHRDELRALVHDVPILGPLRADPHADDDRLADAFLHDVTDLATLETWFR